MLTPLETRPLSPTAYWPAWSLSVVMRVCWPNRFRIGGILTIFTMLGIIVALWMPPEFQSVARIIPEMNNGSGDMLKRLASVAGFSSVDLSEAEDIDAVRPDLYPNVLQSTPFILYLIDQPVSTMDGQLKTVGKLLRPDSESWSWMKRMFRLKSDVSIKNRTAGTVRLSAWQQEVAEEIGERISAKLDPRSGIITIIATMPDANVAATVAQLAMNYLTQYVTTYRTEKARTDLAFYRQRLTEAQERYRKAQFNVFQYDDTHKSIVIQATTMNRHRMAAELTIAQTVYTQLAQKFEQANLNVQARTPVFKVLEPPNVPLKRTSPKRTLLVLLFAGAGLLVGVLDVMTRQADIPGRFRAMTHAEHSIN